MSLSLNPSQPLTSMLKGGTTTQSSSDATLRNITASRQLSTIVATSLGPNGMNKLVVNHLEKIIVTNDCATILKELEIEHPAAKMLSLASQMQDEECGDGTNLCVSFAGELLAKTEELLRMGLHGSEIISGFKKACDATLNEYLPSLCSDNVSDVRSKEELVRVVTPVIMAKQYGSEAVLAPLIAEACLTVMSSSNRVSPDSVRVCKIMGGHVGLSHIVRGMVIQRGAEGTITKATDAKVTVFSCGMEASATEAKGTVLMQNAEDLKGYNKSEETKMDEIIKSIANTGTKVVVSGGSISEMALHFLQKYDIMVVKIGSKWDLRRLCAAVNATALVRLGPATPDEMGHCDAVTVKEMGGRHVTIFSQDDPDARSCRLSTIVLRAATNSLLQDLERAVDDGVRCIETACKDGRLVPGAGATEMELARRVQQLGDTSPGLDQYAIRAFGQAMEFVPRTLAENSGRGASNVLAALYAAHSQGGVSVGVDIDGSKEGIKDVQGDIMDLLTTKMSSLRLAVDATLTVLRVDQIIMSKPAGGPKMQ
mmetsp:Transcript_52936/g.63738  ORF Transcript_52936/g.63738 Transcript_52936/m.63738 type:complete len:539 (-) Transcript_52936:196-1812(-)|eukprot:CAMPEP_0172503252 /NCGR_PEP_ID=MMETSP1066-20121228/167636_1 /TAXON_ID=671091 /ORGANISM="Coscinodiscus wailesii, Strain CCMP2513" /LENGTH=538 /DNA_ID=CAMNT_0013278919 /DNA_START=126 /DNA_END=1742 /DNA_ORIENTATION=+